MQFCDTCGNLLDESTEPFVKCDCCGESVRNTIMSEGQSATTTTKSNNFPSILRLKRSNLQRLSAEDYVSSERITRRCDNPNFDCQAKQMTYRNVQMRGADEGSTIIYKCPGCGYSFQEGN
ncbi:hypothetical protein DL95DRAFT_375182 [Leptodontidium sp. 2 PMI_412]|nr:hypothetical protein DL95DRAFT_375182 [Leptodontidium sp. 2 PMI_412]